MSDVRLALTFQPLCGVASRIKWKLLCAAAQELNASSISNADKEIQIQLERFDAGKRPATTSVRVVEFDFVWCSADDLPQLLPLKHHG